MFPCVTRIPPGLAGSKYVPCVCILQHETQQTRCPDPHLSKRRRCVLGSSSPVRCTRGHAQQFFRATVLPRSYPPHKLSIHMSSALQLVWLVAFAVRSAYSWDTSWNLPRSSKVDAPSGFVCPPAAADRASRPVVHAWWSRSPRVTHR